MQFSMKIPALIFLCVAIAMAGCTGSQTSPAASTPGSGIPATTAGSGAPMRTLTTVPTDVLPGFNMVTVDVGEKDDLGIIPVTFQGGSGTVSYTHLRAHET